MLTAAREYKNEVEQKQQCICGLARDTDEHRIWHCGMTSASRDLLAGDDHTHTPYISKITGWKLHEDENTTLGMRVRLQRHLLRVVLIFQAEQEKAIKEDQDRRVQDVEGPTNTLVTRTQQLRGVCDRACGGVGSNDGGGVVSGNGQESGCSFVRGQEGSRDGGVTLPAEVLGKDAYVKRKDPRACPLPGHIEQYVRGTIGSNPGTRRLKCLKCGAVGKDANRTRFVGTHSRCSVAVRRSRQVHTYTRAERQDLTRRLGADCMG